MKSECFVAIYYWNWFLPGTRAETSSRTQTSSASNQQEGVRGLKALGVRDLCYRMAFLACNVVTRNRKVIILSIFVLTIILNTHTHKYVYIFRMTFIAHFPLCLRKLVIYCLNTLCRILVLIVFSSVRHNILKSATMIEFSATMIEFWYANKTLFVAIDNKINQIVLSFWESETFGQSL